MRLVCLLHCPEVGWRYAREAWATSLHWAAEWAAFGIAVRIVTAEAAREAFGVWVP